MKKLFKFLKEIDYLLLVLIIILLIVCYCYAQLRVFNKTYINFCGYSIFHVITGSMEPTIRIDDIVLVEITNNIHKDIVKGDIITFKYEGDFVTHRIINLDEEKEIVTTKGDANNTEDEPFDSEYIVGKVIYIIPYQILKKVVGTPKVIITIIISFIIISLLFRKQKEDDRLNKIKKEKEK